MKQNPESSAGVEFDSLDPNTKYCLVDTMILLPLAEGDPDMTRDVKRELGGAALVPLSKIVGEATRKHYEAKGINGKNHFRDFAALLTGRLESAGIAFRFARFGHDMYLRWKSMMDKRTHPNLSPADYALLCAATRRPDMDFMTYDRGLIGSINAERGSGARGKRRLVVSNYSKRRGDTAGFIRSKISEHLREDVRVAWRVRIQLTEFLVGDAVVAVLNRSDSCRVDLSTVAKSAKSAAGLRPKLEKEILGFFAGWKPARGKLNRDRGKGWYARRRDDDFYNDWLGGL